MVKAARLEMIRLNIQQYLEHKSQSNVAHPAGVVVGER